MKYKAVIFDLDGTLLDTLQDLADAMNAALEQMGFGAHPVEAYRYFVGDGIANEAKRALPKDKCDEETVTSCVELTRVEYEKNWADHTRPYEGVLELLDWLEKKGILMAVLSNKPDDFTQVMVAKLLPAEKFAAVRGLKDGVGKKPDPTGALEIAKQFKVRPEEVLYLGDTNTDMKTANAAGMYAVGALWGFRTAEELVANGAKTLVKKPGDVLKLL